MSPGFFSIEVFPTCVGVFLRPSTHPSQICCLPHVRGGVSLRAGSVPAPEVVFPTCVGVFLGLPTPESNEESLPHVRGGVSGRLEPRGTKWQSSPRAWGCFRGHRYASAARRVFPTCVGVFPGAIPRDAAVLCLPHVRGGVSSGPSSGLRTRTVFPTCVGVFLPASTSRQTTCGLPHVRGGVSSVHLFLGCTGLSSPRAWGCF